MRIAISTRGLHRGSFAISSIIKWLSRALIDQNTAHELFLYFNDPAYETHFDSSVHKRSVNLGNRFLWDNVWLPYQLRRDRIDVALFMKGTMPLALPCKGAVIIHDMGYFDRAIRPYPPLETLYMSGMMRFSANLAVKVFADSEFTKSQIAGILKIDPGNIVVCYQNSSPLFASEIPPYTLEEVRQQYRLPGDFIFWPAAISPRKNFDRVLQAFQDVRDRIPHHLVITGGEAWGSRRVVRRIRKDFAGRVHLLGQVPAEHVRALYALSAFTIYVSLLEGFGIPILEAFNCGSPVLTSNITSMPEVAGGAAHLVDPYNVAHIAAAMVELVTNASLREGLRQRGFERARFFSWEKTAGIIMENLTMVL
jgi:glycosyltransferase involved in cell wall biosynthesis